jgi:hypothetical protein
MTKSRGRYLRKRGAQCARSISNTARLDLELCSARAKHVAEFMDDGALLRHQQNEQKAK